MDAYSVVMNPVSTEKSVRMMEAENKLVFDVALKSTKKDIKAAIEEMFKATVEDVNTVILPTGKKRAFVKFGENTPAIDIATQLGIM
ncbi:MAG: 50S ribosomal protein L23 [Candidatus Woesearchaeota archaeon]